MFWENILTLILDKKLYNAFSLEGNLRAGLTWCCSESNAVSFDYIETSRAMINKKWWKW